MGEKLPLGPALGRAAHLAKARMDVRMSQYDVTPSQTHVLMYLHRCGGQVPQYTLTEFLRVKPSTANGILDRLAEKGLVERTVSGSDARCRLITLTEKGRARQNLLRRSFQEVEELMVRDLSPEEREQFREMLERIIQSLEEDQTTC